MNIINFLRTRSENARYVRFFSEIFFTRKNGFRILRSLRKNNFYNSAILLFKLLIHVL